MIKKLITLADRLDYLGQVKLASEVDQIIKDLSSDKSKGYFKKNISYTAVVLYEDSANDLAYLVPDGWEKICHHITIHMGAAKDGLEKALIGEEFTVAIEGFASDDKVCAVKVTMPESLRSFYNGKSVPHVTIAVNKKAGGKPVMSNGLNWANLDSVIIRKLTGRLLEVEQGDNSPAERVDIQSYNPIKTATDETGNDNELLEHKVKQNKESTGYDVLDLLKTKLAAAAQKVYDDWVQGSEGLSEHYGAGGICHDIAEAMCDVLGENKIDCISFHYEIGENHTAVFCKLDDGIYSVDISPYVYESGGGYSWCKKKDVKFEPSDVDIDRITANTNKWDEYID